MIQFDHIAYSSEDIDASVEFYRSRFPETEVLYQDSSWALIMSCGVKIAFVDPDQHPPHLAFRVDSRVELMEEAAKTGSSIQKHRDRSESFYTSDPLGNAVEFVFYP